MSISRYRYHHFWVEFEKHEDIRRVFESIFNKIPSIANKEIHIYSVFNYAKVPKPPKGPNELRVSFSGEPYQDDPKLYDVNLNMEENNIAKGIVSVPLFCMMGHENNFWPLYMKPRVYKQKSRFCAFVVSNDGGEVRNKFFSMLNQYKKVHSCGRALNNCDFRAPDYGDAYMDFLNNYKFMICFENSTRPNYLTEKLQNAWRGGTVPIYWGAVNSLKWLNPKAFLYLEDSSEESMIRLIEKIIELDNDDAKYMEIFNQPLLTSNKIPDDFTIDNISDRISKVIDYNLI